MNRELSRRFAFPFVALLVALLLAIPAFAQEPPTLRGEITDLTGRYGDLDRAHDRLEALVDAENAQLFVLIVSTTGTTDIPAYTDAVVRRNNLGARDGLLVLAMDDRTYELWLGSQLLDDVTVDEQDTLLADYLEPGLRDDNVDGAIATLADGLARAIDGDLARQGGGSEGGGGISLWWVLVVIVAIVLIVLAVRSVGAFRARRARSVDLKETDRRNRELAGQANGLLVEVDEALRDATAEVGFAEAQFGPDEAKAVSEGLAEARRLLASAFATRQKLDDGDPETPDERRQLLEAVIADATKAKAALEQQLRRLAELRDLEHRAPELLAALPARIDAAEARLPAAQAAHERLQRYAEAVVAPVRGNLEEARKRFRFSREVQVAGQAALARGEAPLAARSARAAEEALAQGIALLDAIDHLVEQVRDAETRHGDEHAAAAADVEAARRALARGDVPGFEARLAEAEAALTKSAAFARAERPDYLRAYEAAATANRLADEILAGIRDAEEQRRRDAAALESNVRLASSSLRRADDYVGSRRNGVGREARTRLAEAERLLAEAQARANDDARAAAAAAARARELADEAYELARRDFDRYDNQRIPPAGYPRSRSSDGIGGADVAAQIGATVLGGILGGMMRGGGGGFGGTRWGGSSAGGKILRGGLGGLGGGGRSRGGRW